MEFERSAKARAKLITRHPFFGILALRLKIAEVDEIPGFPFAGQHTAMVDGKTIWLATGFIANLTLPELQGLICHEVLHCVMEHTSRRGGREFARWNIACDYAINSIIKDLEQEHKGSGPEAIALPKGGYYDAKYANWSAERIYDDLPNDPDKEGGWTCHVDQSPEEVTLEEQADWKTAVANAAAQAQQAGMLPGSLKRFVTEILEPKVDWREQLRNLMTESARNDFVWHRPNRRFIHAGMVLPGMYSETFGRITCMIDTSGSITQKILNAVAAEISDIHRNVKPKQLDVIYCDASINGEVVEFGPHDELEFEMRGGGGTDFRPPFKLIEESGENPVVAVYLTDGYGPFPNEAPPYSVVWCMTTDVQPPWGHVVRIEV